MLEDLFLQSYPTEKIQKMESEFSLSGTHTEAYLYFVSLYLLALRRVLLSDTFRVKSSFLSTVSQTLADSLLKGLSPLGLLSMDADAIPKKFKEITELLFRLWEESREKGAGPDWYVAKEICYRLTSPERDPPPGLILEVSSVLTSYRASIQTLFEKMEEEYNEGKPGVKK